jgi:hypothetical protein
MRTADSTISTAVYRDGQSLSKSAVYITPLGFCAVWLKTNKSSQSEHTFAYTSAHPDAQPGRLEAFMLADSNLRILRRIA